MARITVTLKWNEKSEQWRMRRAGSGWFLQEFFDCENMHLIFPGLDKKKKNKFTLWVTAEK